MVAVAMSDDPDLRFTNKNINTITESRWKSEHPYMMGYAYAMAVLSTHINRGNCPAYLNRMHKPDLWSKSAKETTEWVKEAFEEKEMYPVDPNLILSTDDTTLFALKGVKDIAAIGIGRSSMQPTPTPQPGVTSW